MAVLGAGGSGSARSGVDDDFQFGSWSPADAASMAQRHAPVGGASARDAMSAIDSFNFPSTGGMGEIPSSATVGSDIPTLDDAIPSLRALQEMGGSVSTSAPELTSLDDVLGGGAGGGGYGGPDPMSLIADQIAAAEQEQQALEGEYQEQLDVLREQYRLAETPAEKAQIQFLLRDIKARRDAGQEAIETSYANAIQSSMERADTMRGQAVTAGESVGDIFRTAADRTGESFEELGGQYDDTAFGVGGEPLSEQAQDWIGLLETAAPREQAASQQLFELGAQDVEALGQALEGESQAQQSQLERMSAALQAQSQQAHQQRVQDRVAQERMALSQAIQGLGSEFRGRRWGLGDQQRDMGLQQAQIAAQQQSEAQAAARQAAADRRRFAMQQAQEQDRRQYEQWQSTTGLGGGNDLSVEEAIGLTELGLDPDTLRRFLGGGADLADIVSGLDLGPSGGRPVE